MGLNEMDEYFAYTKWLSNAMVDVFKKTLSSLSNKLPEDNHHLYINFLTKNPGVEIPKFLKTQYPNDMTIVLEHQFDKLVVKKNEFLKNKRSIAQTLWGSDRTYQKELETQKHQ